MPRDAGPTRDSLIEAGLRLFADRGIHAPLSAVVVAAGQKNTSALHYHFGGREGLLAAITSVHNARIETATGSDARRPDRATRRPRSTTSSGR